jgi:uncharacterized protein (DUF302 family)
MAPFAFQVTLSDPFQQALERVEQALRAEGFGVLTSIDVQATLKEKLNREFRPYTILGACNPTLAHRALLADRSAGVMLPCNVTLETNDAGTVISIVNPEAMLTVGPLGENPELQQIAAEARARLERVAESLEA